MTEEEKLQIKKCWDFLSEFANRYDEEECKLPYQINVFDELRVRTDENTHSRILAKLFNQKTSDGKHEIFENFIQYIQKKEHGSFWNIRVKNPNITQEKERIDLLIRDEGHYAIIIENKINGASDQKEQLARYIDCVKKDFNDNQIFLIYLTSTKDNEPTDQTWGEGRYKEQFKERYLHLTFRDDILTWLIDKVLPNVRLKDKLLSSALEQYIDHLKGMFNTRDNQIIYMELQEFLKKEWALNDNARENYLKLLSKEDTIKKVNGLIESLKTEIDKSFEPLFEKWNKSIEKNYPDLPTIQGKTQAGVSIQIESQTLRVWLGYEEGRLYCQVEDTDKPISKKIIEKLESLSLDEKWRGDQGRGKWLVSNTIDELDKEGYNLIEKVIKCFFEFR